jgi:nucleoside-diphosphate-sugar epimerase
MRVLILGGTRFVGRHLARLLLAGGAEVTLLHRGVTGDPIPGATAISGDRSQPDGLAGLGEQRFDAVVDMSAYFSDWTRAAADGLTGRVAHYVFISSGAVYRPSAELPWPESTPFGPIPIWGAYGREKVASERLLWEAHAEGRFAVTAFRFPFILGPGNFADRESFAFGRLSTGRPILLPGDGSALNQFVYAEDVARAIVATLERPEVAGGQAYNCLHPRPITNRGWVELCADVLGVDAEIVSIDESELGVAAETVDLTNIVFPYPAEHYVLDGSKLTRELGVEMATGNRRMIEEYGAWWESLADKPPLRAYERENAALSRLGLPTL